MAVNDIYQAVLDFKHKEIAGLVQKELALETDVSEIIQDGLIAAMDELGRLYSEGTLFVPEMLIGAMTMKNGLAVLKPILAETNIQSKGTIVIGTVKGDQHDVGKNLVAMMLEGAGFNVVDIGVDNDTAAFVKAISENNADIAALSSLLTTSMPSMEKIVAELKEQVSDIKTMVGGAPVSIEFAERIGSSGYGENGPKAVQAARSLMKM
ncbi:cobalamin B12-binding domain-containing protein [Desulfobacula phenolica]|uniref:Methylmalonyl-CoA mutase C-terminal domain-containing protein n=1 Tax=Desulfobacula phenolica TaxID=90732 RepID=A0A1H2DQ50_9BACT|nr:cobalamin-dependent protein [Desulfobacula phenolica]SDT84946.1 methylmalonyl-CoA mutase C-terminal domain-containing protein [Desulfobacula phenolica]